MFREIDAVGVDSVGGGKSGENERGFDLHELRGGCEFDSHLHAERSASRAEPHDGAEDGGGGGEALWWECSVFGSGEGYEGVCCDVM